MSDDGAICVVTSLEAPLLETHIGLWQCGGGLDGPCAAAEEVRKVFVLAARCRGPMGAGGLELAGKVQW